MPSGISDGSDFGNSVHGGGPTPTRFRRYDRERPELVSEISVFPHERDGGLKQQLDKAARRAGLVPQYVWDEAPGAEQSVDGILSVDPWDGGCITPPEGAYADASGSTTYGAECWKLPRRRGGHLVISYVIWKFREAGNFTTSLVVKIVPPLYPTTQEIDEQKRCATAIANAVKSWLLASPPSPASVILRGEIGVSSFFRRKKN